MIDRVKQVRKDTQRLLREDYQESKAKLEIIPERIATEKARLTQVRTSSVDTVSKGSHAERLDRETAIILSIDQLQAELKTAKLEIAVIEKILSTLSDEELRCIQVFDLDGQRGAVDRVCGELFKERATIYDIYNGALYKIARLYWGGKRRA